MSNRRDCSPKGEKAGSKGSHQVINLARERKRLKRKLPKPSRGPDSAA